MNIAKHTNNWYWKKTEREQPSRYSTKYVYVATGICSVCGQEFNNGNVAASKYCSKCAADIKREKTRARVAKYRAAKRQQDYKATASR